jgi:hypothetical protein
MEGETIMNNSMAHTEQTTCPDWCQSKPHDDNPDGSFDGPHTWLELPAIDGDGDFSALVSVDYRPGAAHKSVISLIAPNLSLTPKQARSVALGLLTVADWAEGHEASS